MKKTEMFLIGGILLAIVISSFVFMASPSSEELKFGDVVQISEPFYSQCNQAVVIKKAQDDNYEVALVCLLQSPLAAKTYVFPTSGLTKVSQ